jgi:hypothetical protein
VGILTLLLPANLRPAGGPELALLVFQLWESDERANPLTAALILLWISRSANGNGFQQTSTFTNQ